MTVLPAIKLNTVIGAALLVVVSGMGGASWRYRKPLLLIMATLAGRNPYCSLRHLLRAPANYYVGRDMTNAVMKKCRAVEHDSAGLVLWDTPYGRLWTPVAVPEKFVARVLAEQEIQDIYTSRLQTIRPGDVVLDCGANVGVFTRRALKGKAAKVVAIEPSPTNAECLRRNLKAEIASGVVIVVPKALWDVPGSLRLGINDGNRAADRLNEAGGKLRATVEVPVTTIDELAAELRLNRVDFIKMNIVGAERKALLGGASTLRTYRPKLAIMTIYGEADPKELPAVVTEINPAYSMECGLCVFDANWRIRPDVLLFH